VKAMGIAHSNAAFSAKEEQLGNSRLQFITLILFHQTTIWYVQCKVTQPLKLLPFFLQIAEPFSFIKSFVHVNGLFLQRVSNINFMTILRGTAPFSVSFKKWKSK